MLFLAVLHFFMALLCYSAKLASNAFLRKGFGFITANHFSSFMSQEFHPRKPNKIEAEPRDLFPVP